MEVGNLESDLLAKRGAINAKDTNGISKLFTMNETGLLDGKVQPDSQTLIGTHNYGIWTLDMVIQSIRAGMAGQIPWDMDDCQHTGGGYGQDNLKEWGFWNIYGGRDGYPASDRNPRPWFYTWSLMSKFFPQGCQTLNVSYSSSLPGLRAVAMKKTNAGGFDLSVAMVNDSDTGYSVKVVVANATTAYPINQYNYQNGNYPVDANNLPVRASAYGADFRAGTYLYLEPRSAIILTTLNDAPRFSVVRWTAQGAQTQVQGRPGATYQLLVSADLRGWTAWRTITCDSSGTAGTVDVTVGQSARFYRAEFLP